MFLSQTNILGFKSDTIVIEADVETSINVGSGLLILRTFGAMNCEIYGIDYWSADIQEIFKTKNSVGVSLSKAESAGQINLYPSKSRRIAYIFIGEIMN